MLEGHHGRKQSRANHRHFALPAPQRKGVQPTSDEKIVSAARELQRAIKQQPAKAPMEELSAIKLLRQVLLGDKPLELSNKPMSTLAHATKKRLVNGELIGSKRNNIQPASRKRVQQ